MQAFFKYQGAGNDFIILDNRTLWMDGSDVQLIKNLCDRRFGIGADGLMLLENANGYDFKMRYFNADGREGSLCGNGGRCIVAFAKDLGLIQSDRTEFLAVDGPHTAILTGISTLQEFDQTFPVTDQAGSAFHPKYTIRLQMQDITEISRDGEAWVLNTGSPHYVEEIQGLSQFALVEVSKKIRYGAVYGNEGINVNFVEGVGPNAYEIRTYERGVEDETYACGTGATAAAIAMAEKNGLQGPQKITMKAVGGLLNIYFNKKGNQYTEVYLEGPAEFVFEGNLQLARFTH